MKTFKTFGVAFFLLLSTGAQASELTLVESIGARAYPSIARNVAKVTKTASALAASGISPRSKREMLGQYLAWAEKHASGRRIEELREDLGSGDFARFADRCKRVAEELEFLASKN